MAKSLKDKFEHWEPDKHSMNNAVTMLDSEQESIESTKSLRARFESLKGDRSYFYIKNLVGGGVKCFYHNFIMNK